MAEVRYTVCDRCSEKINSNFPTRLNRKRNGKTIKATSHGWDYEYTLCNKCEKKLQLFLRNKETEGAE